MRVQCGTITVRPESHSDMSLMGFQFALGQALLGRMCGHDAQFDDIDLSPIECSSLKRTLASAGFRITADIQRSWCEARTARSVALPLAILSVEERCQLVGEWVNQGGGTNSFFEAEGEAFLRFLEQRLPNPSHALTLCQLEQATRKATNVLGRFVPLDVSTICGSKLLTKSPHATLVHFFAEPECLLLTIKGERMTPPLLPTAIPVLVAPGLSGQIFPVDAPQEALLQSLETPATVHALIAGGHALGTIEFLVTVGALTFA